MEKMRIVQWNCRSLLPSLMAVIMTMSGFAHAGLIKGAPRAEGAGRAWNIPYDPVSPGMVAGLQEFLRTPAGAGLLAQAPSLSFIEALNPDSETHRRIVGVLGLPPDFEARLESAVAASDGGALAGARDAILGAYRSRNMEGKINKAVEARAGKIIEAVYLGGIGVDELSAAAMELAPFMSFSPRAKAVGELASAARSAGTMRKATRMAQTLVETNAFADAQAAGKPAAVSETVQEVPVADPDLAAARDLVHQSRRVGFDFREEIVDRMLALTKNTPKETVHVVIARGLSGNIQNIGLLTHRSRDYTVEALRRLSDISTHDSVKEIAIQGIMDHLSKVADESNRYFEAAVGWGEPYDAVEHIVMGSTNKRVKEVAINLLRREMQNKGYTRARREFIRSTIENIAATMGDEAIKVPAPEMDSRNDEHEAPLYVLVGALVAIAAISIVTWVTTVLFHP